MRYRGGTPVQHVFVVGSKGIPGNYGGYETFVDKLTEYHEKNPSVKYHVACRAEENGEFEYHGARCFRVKVPNVGPASAILYDIAALKSVVKYIRDHKIENAIVYCLACRIGPFIGKYRRQIHKLGGKLLVNPDGHEWLRAKWCFAVRAYWKFSERLMVKQADLLVCDSVSIEKYIRETYKAYSPKTRFIAYGAEIRQSKLADDDKKFTDWLLEKNLRAKEYYLVVGRFVPENNYETMIREFMRSSSTKDFAIITNVNNEFLNELERKLHFKKDKRIKFVGTVYDEELLKKIREKAYGYFHGHEVGGTNPSLLEALSSTDLNLLLDVSFNREVAEDAAIYWTKKPGSLAETIKKADAMPPEEIAKFAKAGLARIASAYSWEFIACEYERLWGRLCG